jgi:iron-sulfur cluster repair protein YtfE (RIC family)
MVSFSSEESLENLKQKLKEIDPDIAEHVEIEELILYPHVVQRIQKYGLRHVSGYEPNKIPKEQV